MKIIFAVFLLASCLLAQEREITIKGDSSEFPTHNRIFVRIYAQRDTLKLHTNAIVDSAAKIILNSMVSQWHEQLARYDSLCQAYNELYKYNQGFYKLSKTFYEIAHEHKFLSEEQEKFWSGVFSSNNFKELKPCHK